jgi:opacity protein-like surface antigen
LSTNSSTGLLGGGWVEKSRESSGCRQKSAAPFAAGAADLALVPPVAPAWSWTGVYAGVHLASGWASNTWQSATGPLADPGFEPFFGLGAGNGAVAGGQFGLNYQAGPWVLGPELALSAADINTSTLCGRGRFSCTAVIDGLGTLTARFGFAFDQFLIYTNVALVDLRRKNTAFFKTALSTVA